MTNKQRNILVFLGLTTALLGGAGWYFLGGDTARLDIAEVSGPSPVISEPRKEAFPTINVAAVDRWKSGEAPVAAKGLAVARFAEGLDHPRALMVLPNGDILVAETNSPPRENKGAEGMVMRWLMDKAGAGTPSANRIALLRDADGDGKAEVKTTLIQGLNSPYGMALVGDTLYVATTDAVTAYPFTPGQTRISAAGRKIATLPSAAPNNHWTRTLLADADGTRLYVGIGSATNIAEKGLEVEKGRARIIEINLENGKKRDFAVGLRNPVGMAWEPN